MFVSRADLMQMSLCTGALLILGGLMLNLVASGMLLRPINVRPSTSSSPSSPSSPSIQKGQNGVCNGQEKEPLKNGMNGSTPLANGIAKDSSPSATWATSSPDIKGQRQNGLTNVDSTQLVQNGKNRLENDCIMNGDAPLEQNGGSARADASLHEKASSEKASKKPKALDFSLLKNPFFCIYTWSLVFSQLAYFIPYFHLSARARNLGIDAMDASFIISLAGD